MMKNTNHLACMVVSVDNSAAIAPEDFSLCLVASNGIMDAWNRPVATSVTTYRPYSAGAVTFDDSDYGLLHGAQYAISTLRLMEGGDCRIILCRKTTGDVVFDISLAEYIGMVGQLYTNLGRPLSVQEYLDRQDFYTVVFFLSGDLTQLLQLKVNSWRLRSNYHLKL